MKDKGYDYNKAHLLANEKYPWEYKKKDIQMDKFEKLMQKGSKVYYKYFLFGSDLEECIGELCIDTDTDEAAIIRLAEYDRDNGNHILVAALYLKRNGYPDKYTYAYC